MRSFSQKIKQIGCFIFVVVALFCIKRTTPYRPPLTPTDVGITQQVKNPQKALERATKNKNGSNIDEPWVGNLRGGGSKKLENFSGSNGSANAKNGDTCKRNNRVPNNLFDVALLPNILAVRRWAETIDNWGDRHYILRKTREAEYWESIQRRFKEAWLRRDRRFRPDPQFSLLPDNVLILVLILLGAVRHLRFFAQEFADDHEVSDCISRL